MLGRVRMCHAEIRHHHHHLAGAYLLRFAREALRRFSASQQYHPVDPLIGTPGVASTLVAGSGASILANTTARHPSLKNSRQSPSGKLISRPCNASYLRRVRCSSDAFATRSAQCARDGCGRLQRLELA